MHRRKPPADSQPQDPRGIPFVHPLKLAFDPRSDISLPALHICVIAGDRRVKAVRHIQWVVSFHPKNGSKTVLRGPRKICSELYALSDAKALRASSMARKHFCSRSSIVARAGRRSQRHTTGKIDGPSCKAAVSPAPIVLALLEHYSLLPAPPTVRYPQCHPQTVLVCCLFMASEISEYSVSHKVKERARPKSWPFCFT